MTETETARTETLGFQAEVQQLLHLVVHSLYGHKEIFLRELISNASDACDKLRFEALTHEGLMEDEGALAIRVSVDRKRRLVTVQDNGIGMSRDEVIEHIGTIARSGTRQFLESLTGDAAKDTRLIGQFGVGFYSVFMVADRVTLTTRRAGLPADQGVRWESDGQGSYTVTPVARPQRGTEVTLHLRKGEDEFLDPHRLRAIIAKYSDHISLPIQMPREGAKQGEDAWETVNKGSALWARPKKEIKEAEYQDFYQALTYDDQPPLTWLHTQVEGKLEYTTLFFVPARAPFDLWDREHRHGVKLYVRRIFIMDDTKHLLPAYLRFVRGIVDAADLPLNVSREFLQHNKQIDTIRAAGTKRLLKHFQSLADKDPERYQTLWDQYGRVLKEGIAEDPDNRALLAELFRFATTHDDDLKQRHSLKDYVSRMQDKQKAIYYLTAESPEAARQSPHLEVFRKRGVEVLLLGEPIDEWLVTHLTEYQGKPLKSVAKGELDDEALAAEQDKADEKAYADLLKGIQEALPERVKAVRLSRRLTDSPACLVADEHDLSANLERILKAVGQVVPEHKPILEINPDHPLIRHLETRPERLADWAQVLFDQAALSEGAPLKAPADYVRRVNRLIAETLLGGTGAEHRGSPD